MIGLRNSISQKSIIENYVKLKFESGDKRHNLLLIG